MPSRKQACGFAASVRDGSWGHAQARVAPARRDAVAGRTLTSCSGGCGENRLYGRLTSRHEGCPMSLAIRRSALAGCTLLAGALGLAGCSPSSPPPSTAGGTPASLSRGATAMTPPAPAGTSATATRGANVEGTRLLRFPDICGDRVVFTYAGDLWTVSAQGGTATRLTAGPGNGRALLARLQADRLHRPVRRRQPGLCGVRRRRRAETIDLLSRDGPAAAALGLRQPGVRLDAGREIGAVPLVARLAQHFRSARVHRARHGRPADRVADAAIGRGAFLARRQADRVFAQVPRFP